jgi:uncharacterized protein (UPF0332 family)
VFDWDNFLALASDLAGRQGDEAAARTAVSRSYYATFHAGRGLLRKANVPVDTGGRSHRQVQQALARLDEQLGEDVERLHRWRKEADYETECSFDIEEQAPVIVRLSLDLIGRIRSLS